MQLLIKELGEEGYAGVDLRVTPVKTEIIIRATRTQNVLGEKGRRIRELTSVIQKRYVFVVLCVMCVWTCCMGVCVCVKLMRQKGMDGRGGGGKDRDFPWRDRSLFLLMYLHH